MKTNEAELKGVYRAETTRTEERRSACPTGEDLVAFVCGPPSQAERERIGNHLATCSDCAQEFRLLQSLYRPAEAIFAGRAQEDSRMPADAPRRSESRGHRWFSPSRLSAGLAPALAASLLLVAIASGLAALSFGLQSRRLHQELAGKEQVLTDTGRRLADATRQAAESSAETAKLRQTVDSLAQPQLNVPIVDLDPRDAFRGTPDRARKTVDLPANAAFVTLILNVVGDTPYGDYGLEIVDRAGTVVWSGQGLERSVLNTFTVTLPRQLVGSGLYHIKLYGLGGGARTRLEDYALQFRIR